jgi:hypothetical protein
VPMFELFKLFNSKISNSNRRRSGGWFWNPISMIPGFRGNRVSHDDAKRGTYTEFCTRTYSNRSLVRYQYVASFSLGFLNIYLEASNLLEPRTYSNKDR